MLLPSAAPISLFQSTLPRRERLHDVKRFLLVVAISIHAPAKGATRACRAAKLRRLYFNPRSREGSDAQDVLDMIEAAISIHAPAKGATLPPSPAHCPQGFQSTLPRRERPLPAHSAVRSTDISIHAPAKGATRCRHTAQLQRTNFNPRSREGSDVIRISTMTSNQQFQSTLPRRERHTVITTKENTNHHFNPRSREGSDEIAALVKERDEAFQSTLPRRERPAFAKVVISSALFQSTLPRRERQQKSPRLFPMIFAK